MSQASSSSEFSELLAKVRYSSDNGAIFQGKFVNLDTIRNKCLSHWHKKVSEIDDKELSFAVMQTLNEMNIVSAKESPRLFFEQSMFPASSPPNSLGNTPRSRLPTMDEMRSTTGVPSLTGKMPTTDLSPRFTKHPPFSEGSFLDSGRLSARSGLSIPAFYNKFWEMAFALFVNVASPFVSHDVCFQQILELLNFLRQKEASPNPALFVVLDIVVQRAMYELSDKVVKIDSNVNTAATSTPPGESHFSALVSSHANTEGMHHIENCVKIMHTVAIPLCLQEQAAIGLGYLAETNASVSIGCKMSTLNRQLQELLAWTTLQHQSKLPINFPDTGAVNVLTSATSLQPQSMEMTMDQTLAAMIDEHLVNLQEDVPYFIAMKLSKVIAPNMGVQVNIQTCGSSSFPSFYSEDMFTLDFAVTTSDRAGILKHDDPELLKLHARSEKIIHWECALDAGLKHIKACLKDFLHTSMDIARSVCQSVPELSLRWEKETELLHTIGNQLVEHFVSVKMMRQNQYPLLMATVNKYEQLQEHLERDEKDRISQLRKIAKVLERACREAGFVDVKNENSRARFVNLKMISFDTMTSNSNNNSVQPSSIPCMVILDSQLPNIATRCLAEYISLDSTGKMRLFFNILRKFVKSHSICDSSKGFLSPFAWTVLGLHVLLREQLVPNIHSSIVAAYSNNNNDMAETSIVSLLSSLTISEHLCRMTTERFANISIVQLLDRFFRYYVEEFDLFSAVVSLRGQGELLPKTSWKKTNAPVLWRISIEDPFELLSTSRSAYDLGSTMSRPGQLTTFKTLRRALYGIASMLSSGADQCRANLRKFFSKTELIHLARKSDYAGAIITPPKDSLDLNNNNVSTSLMDKMNALTGGETIPNNLHEKVTMFSLTMLSLPPNNEALGMLLNQANGLLAKLPPLQLSPTPQMSPRVSQDILNTQRSSAPSSQRSLGTSYYQSETSTVGSTFGNLRFNSNTTGMNTTPSTTRSFVGHESLGYHSNSNLPSARSARDFTHTYLSPRQPFGNSNNSMMNSNNTNNNNASGFLNMSSSTANYTNNNHPNSNNNRSPQQPQHRPSVPSLNFHSVTSNSSSSTSSLNPYANIFNFNANNNNINNNDINNNSAMDGWSRMDTVNAHSGPKSGRKQPHYANNSGNNTYHHNNNNNTPNNNNGYHHHYNAFNKHVISNISNSSSTQRAPPMVPILNLSGSVNSHSVNNSNNNPSLFSTSPVPPATSAPYWTGSDISPRYPLTSDASSNILHFASGASHSSVSAAEEAFFQSTVLPLGSLSVSSLPPPHSYHSTIENNQSNTSQLNTQRSLTNNNNVDGSVDSNSTDYAQEISSLVMNQQQQLPSSATGVAASGLFANSHSNSNIESESAPSSARSYHLYRHQQQLQQQHQNSPTYSFMH